MATWMEKDVLIECISSVLGPTSWTHEIDDPDRIAYYSNKADYME